MEPTNLNVSSDGLATPPPAFLPGPLKSSRAIEWMRSIWKIVFFFLVTVVLGPTLLYALVLKLFGGLGSPLWPGVMLFLEAGELAVLFAFTAAMSMVEHVPFGAYGLPLKGAFGANYWVGFLLGLAEGSVLVGLILVFGGYSFGTWALQGSAVIAWGLLQLVLFVVVGLYEEFVFRGYAQYTMSKLIGFWPAAILLSAGFGLIHLSNRGEDWVGALSVAMVGLLFAFALKRSGNLWYAVGLHAGFDWAESFLYSVPDSGEMLKGHLSNAVLHGPAWLTGGSIGPEGSVFCFMTLGLQFLLVNWLFAAPKHEATAAGVAAE
jgi:CAAX protease family protein